ncbi:hypothetical protein F5J12DRAFT_727692, partial [Pisolithus orientalis]|uniref:uncharacterized protein n=1 Tax=Pisolithus orientalis TaxID=936130 RepID=UPI002223F89D
PWVTLAGNSTMGHYFKLLHAQEEIEHLEVEAHRLLMYLRDKECFVDESEQQVQALHPPLAHQIACYYSIHSCFTSQHLKHLHDITKLPSYKGSLSFSESV